MTNPFTRPVPPSERHSAPPPLRPDDVVVALALFAFVAVVPLVVLP